MCGIVGAAAQRDVTPILVEGLRRLEYRGYDSAGVAVLEDDHQIARQRTVGKVAALVDAIAESPIKGCTGIAHTRWATHGKPTQNNAHPHMSGDDVAIVHNGIIENFETLRGNLKKSGYLFDSETDTESVVHTIDAYLKQDQDLLKAVISTIDDLEGAYALGVIRANEPNRLIAARKGSPLVIGVGFGEYFIASDIFALLPVTQRYMILEDGDVADIRPDKLTIYDAKGVEVFREINVSSLTPDSTDKGGYRHYMLKEIFEQPAVLKETLSGRITATKVIEESFGASASEIFDTVENVMIIACGTSFHAGSVARYWMEDIAGVPCQVEVASEFRYRKHCIRPNTLFVTISQSGETADTLAALEEAKRLGYAHTLAICNVPESSITRESELVLLTRAGPEIGVASTKAFTTQLVSLMLLVIAIGRRHELSEEREADLVRQLASLPEQIDRALDMNEQIERLSEAFADKHHALYLGRGAQHPVAMEGALKMKEISYIHAEAYQAGELKHGPLALVDDDMPVVAVAPNNELLEKLKSNLQEVRSRGGQLYVFADPDVKFEETEGVTVLEVASVEDEIAPIIYTIPLQLLSYHVAVQRGTDVDQPRNLAKSVTVE